MSREVELVIKNLPTKKSSGPDGFLGEFCHTLKELNPILEVSQNVEEEETLPKSFYEANITLIQKPDKDTTKTNKQTNKKL